MSKEAEKFSERYFQKDNICILQKGILPMGILPKLHRKED